MKHRLIAYIVLMVGLLPQRRPFFPSLKKVTKVINNETGLSSDPISERQSQLIFNSIMSFPDNTEFSIALITDGEVRFVGAKRQNNRVITINNYQSAFEIGSLSKVFTATLLSNFVIENKLSLDDDIKSLLGFRINFKKNITFGQLANHTSGLPRLPANFEISVDNQANPFKHYDEHKLVEYLRSEMQLNPEPGTKYEYSNLGSGLLGYALAQVSNSSYELLLNDKIFSRYNMRNSTSKRETLRVKLVNGLDPSGDKVSNWDFKVLAGAGAIISTVADLSIFALAQFEEGNSELQLTHQPTFKVSNKMSVGLGWHILKKKKGVHLIWHNGATGGYRSSMALDLKNKNGVIILSNVSTFHKYAKRIDQLCFKLIAMTNE